LEQAQKGLIEANPVAFFTLSFHLPALAGGTSLVFMLVGVEFYLFLLLRNDYN
jgi:hypothetical protein